MVVQAIIASTAIGALTSIVFGRIISASVRAVGVAIAYAAYKYGIEPNLMPEKVLAKIGQESPYTNLRDETYIKENLKELVGFINFLRDFNVTLAANTMFASILGPEVGVPFSNLINALQWSYGLGWLSWIGTGEFLSRVVSRPLRQKLNKILRDADITRDVKEKLYAYGAYNLQQFKEAMAEEGWPDEIINKYLPVLWTELRSGAIEELVALGQISEEEYKNKLKEIGIKPEVAEKVVKKLYKLPSLAEIRRAVKNGLISEEYARELLILQGYKPEFAELLLKDVRAEKIENERNLTKSDILRAFEYGIIREEQAREFLKSLGYDLNEIEILIELSKKRIALRNIDKGRDLAKNDIINAYINDVISKAEALNLLTQIGYERSEAEILLSIADKRKGAKNVEKKRELARSDIVKAYKQGLISREEAINMIKSLGFSEEDAELILKIGTYEKPKERRLTLSELRRLYNDGLITFNEYRQALIALGYSEEDVDLIIIREKPRLSASLLIDAFGAGLIDKKFVYEYCKKEGMSYIEIVALFRAGALEETHAKELLKRFGFDDKEIEILLRFAR